MSPLVNFVTHYYTIFFHELGHTIAAWMLGSMAIPTFNTVSGGGATYQIGRPFILALINFIFVISILLAIKNRSKKTNSKKLMMFFVIYCLIFFSSLREIIITSMGIGGELIFSFIFTWYALFKLQTKYDGKGIFYLFLALILLINSVFFATSLIFNEVAIQRYINHDGITNDLVKLTQSTGLSISFYSWMVLFIAFFGFLKILKINKIQPPSKQKIKKIIKNHFQFSLRKGQEFIEKFKNSKH